jgi:hypothetical protein
MNKLFEIPETQPPKKERKQRRKSTRYNKSENNRRYKLHRKVKNLSNVKLLVRQKTIILPPNLNLEFYPSVEELVFKFKYFAPVEITPSDF